MTRLLCWLCRRFGGFLRGGVSIIYSPLAGVVAVVCFTPCRVCHLCKPQTPPSIYPSFCAITKNRLEMNIFISSLLTGAPEETRTPDLLIRSQTLYPAELPALVHRVCRGTFIIIPPADPNVKHFFKVFCGFCKKFGFARSYVLLFAVFLLAVCPKRPYTRNIYYRFGCDFV